MSGPDKQLVPFRNSSLSGRLRSTWLQYQEAGRLLHVIVPAGIGVLAGVALTWAWTMLDQHEYGVAMLALAFFLVVGVGAALAITRKLLRVIALVLVLLVTAFSGAKVWIEKGDRPWTVIWPLPSRAQAVPSPTPAAPSSTLSNPSYAAFEAERSQGKTKQFTYYSRYDQGNIGITVKIGLREMPVNEVSRFLVAYIAVNRPFYEGETILSNACTFVLDKFDIISDDLLKELGEDRLQAIGQNIQWERRVVIYYNTALPEEKKVFLKQYARDERIDLVLMGQTRKDVMKFVNPW